MKPTIIFVHGLFGTSRDWESIVPGFPDYSCRTITLPGHGANPVLKEDFAVSTLSAWLFNEVEKISGGCHFVGYSLGGRVLLSLFERAPNLFQSLTLESVSPGLIDNSEREVRVRKDQKWANLIKTLSPMEFFENWYDQDLFKSLKNKPFFDDLVKARVRDFNPKLVQVLSDSSPGRTSPMCSILKKIPNGLFVTGASDSKYVSMAQSVVAQAPNIKIEIVPNAGHSVHLEQPEEFINILRSHLNRRN